MSIVIYTVCYVYEPVSQHADECDIMSINMTGFLRVSEKKRGGCF